MAPGCFTTSTSSKDSSNNGKESQTTSAILEAMDPIVLNFESDSFNVDESYNSDETDTILIISKETLQSQTISHESFSTDQIDLDSIPLPLSPPPPSDQYEDDEEDEDEKEGKHLGNNSPRLFLPRQRSPNQIFDTVDAFEILEQTIIKQKRVAKLKNTDLRRKVSQLLNLFIKNPLYKS